MMCASVSVGSGAGAGAGAVLGACAGAALALVYYAPRPRRAKRGWAGYILFFGIFRFLPGYYRLNCLEVYCLHI